MATVCFIDSIFVLCLTIGYQIFVNDLLEKLNAANAASEVYTAAYVAFLSTPRTSPNYLTNLQAMSVAWDKFLPLMTIFLQELPKIQYISWLFFLYIFKDINIILFAKLRHKTISQYFIEFSLTIIQTFFLLVLLIEISDYFNVDIPESDIAYYPTVGQKVINEDFIKFNV